jgi:hypothetical protein
VQAKFHLAIAYPPSKRLRSHRCGATRALAAFEAFAVEEYSLREQTLLSSL